MAPLRPKVTLAYRHDDADVGAGLFRYPDEIGGDAKLLQSVRESPAGMAANKPQGHEFATQLLHHSRYVESLAANINSKFAGAQYGSLHMSIQRKIRHKRFKDRSTKSRSERLGRLETNRIPLEVSDCTRHLI